MYEQGFQGDVFYMMLYAAVAAMSLIACCYLLLRRGNAFATDITPPVRLRRWTAAFFAAITLCHLWYLPTYFLTSSDERMQGYLIAGLLDCMTVIPLTIIILLVMLQDRRRPLWPVCAMVIPLIVGRAWCVVNRSEDLNPMLFAYFTLMSIALVIYIIRATRQYSRWLRDNFADLEHKEVWQSFVLLAVILLTFTIYSFDMGGLAYEYAMEVNIIILIGYLLWRVETLIDLGISLQQDFPSAEIVLHDLADAEYLERSSSASENIDSLLQKYCIDTRLYLQHDLTLLQLAKAIGTNRFYLSQYFSRQGTTYNAYINGLRIDHFVTLYHQTVAAKQNFTVRKLAQESGYRNYATFSNAFKQRMGKSASAWMQEV